MCKYIRKGFCVHLQSAAYPEQPHHKPVCPEIFLSKYKNCVEHSVINPDLGRLPAEMEADFYRDHN